MSDDTVLLAGLTVSGALLVAAVVCAALRIIRGPSGPDRVVALDMLSLLAVAATGAAVLASGATAFIDIGLGVALVGFLATVAFAGFIERGSIDEAQEEEEER